MKANINDGIIQKGKCHFEKIQSQQLLFFLFTISYLNFNVLYSMAAFESNNHKYNKERFRKSLRSEKRTNKQILHSEKVIDIETNNGPFYICVLENLFISRIKI